MILTPDGQPASEFPLLDGEEARVIEKAFGLNRRHAKADRNRYSAGRVKKGDAIAVLLASMAEKGLVTLEWDASRAVLEKRFYCGGDKKNGDLRKTDLVARVTLFGAKCFARTVKA